MAADTSVLVIFSKNGDETLLEFVSLNASRRRIQSLADRTVAQRIEIIVREVCNLPNKAEIRAVLPVSGLPRITILPRSKSISPHVSDRASPSQQPVNASPAARSAHALEKRPCPSRIS
jgi:hypothetical protein